MRHDYTESMFVYYNSQHLGVRRSYLYMMIEGHNDQGQNPLMVAPQANIHDTPCEGVRGPLQLLTAIAETIQSNILGSKNKRRQSRRNISGLQANDRLQKRTPQVIAFETTAAL